MAKTETRPTTATPHQKLLSVVVIVVGLAVSLLITAILAFTFFPAPNISIASENSNQTPEPTPTPDPLAPFNILLLGYGGFEHDGGELTDTMLISHIRPRDKTITLISLPRDTWVPLHLDKDSTESAHFKINHAFALGNDDDSYSNKPDRYTGDNGGINLATDTVETATGLHIKNTVAVSFYSFTRTIDTLGGVDVVVPVTFDDEYYPIKGEEDNTCEKPEEEIEALEATLSGDLLNQEFKCRYEHLHFDSGLTHMDGVTALKFVRSRHSEQDGGDFGRSRRQQALVEAVKDKVLALNFIPKIYPLLKDFKNSVYTDISASTITDGLKLLGDIDEYEIKSLNLNTDKDNVLQFNVSLDGQSILAPKTGIDQWQGIHEFIERSLTPPESTDSAIIQP